MEKNSISRQECETLRTAEARRVDELKRIADEKTEAALMKANILEERIAHICTDLSAIRGDQTRLTWAIVSLVLAEVVMRLLKM